MGVISKSVEGYLAMVSGFIAIFYSFYYVEQLSYSVGFNTGLLGVAETYNISIPKSIALSNAAISIQTLRFAWYIPYIMLPFALIMFGIGIIWVLSKSHQRITSISLCFASLIFVMLSLLLQVNLHFSGDLAIGVLSLSFVGGGAGILAGIAGFVDAYPQQDKNRSVGGIRSIAIDPQTPYTNMINLASRLKLTGHVMILDMHFDYKAVENLSRLISRSYGRYDAIMLLTKQDRLGKDFMKSYSDLKEELMAANVTLEIRILHQKDASEQHERLLIDSFRAYKIPPLNIINKKSEHIVSINYQNALKRFNDLWARATKYENSTG